MAAMRSMPPLGLFEGQRHLPLEELQVAGLLRLADADNSAFENFLLFRQGQDILVFQEDRNDVLEGFLDKTDVVTDVLGGCVEFVGDPGGELATASSFCDC